MKLGEIKKLCKASGCVRLYDEEEKKLGMSTKEMLEILTEYMDEDSLPTPPRQWISDGVGAYPLDGLPYLDEESVCAIFDIDAKKRDKLVVSHAGTLPEGMDFTDHHRGDDPLEQLDFQMSLGGNELTLFRDGGGGLVVIKSAYRKPLEAWNECECFKRVHPAGPDLSLQDRGAAGGDPRSGLQCRRCGGGTGADEDMTETKTKLKRCPCCGGMAAVRQEQKPMEDADGNYHDIWIWKVACLACGLSTAWAFDRESVCRRWNMRAE